MRHFNLFSNILITKGAGRILISDLQRKISDLYPLELYDVIEELKNESIENILENYDIESQQIIHEYIDFLLEKEYGFITHGDWDKNFLPLSNEFQEVSRISNVFIEIDNVIILDKIKNSVNNLGVKYLVIYCNKELSLKEYQDIDNKFKDSVLEGIEIYAPFHNALNKEFFQILNQTTTRIYNFVFYNCDEVPLKTKEVFRFNINFNHENLKISACGKVDLKYFNTNLPKVLEAINHNSCLHKKIGIDIHGNIKNCPLMPENYGNIHHSSLEEAVMQNNFKKYWNLTKDSIETCKDCEFRYICTDCRAYTENNHNNKDGLDVSKPLKCGYNPYTCTWEDWSKNPLKQKAMEHYNMENILN
ncbi:grasp-with-spasm system SPASM domain peptide maturase [Chryseobacterium sp. BIGb0232]|uniref:grasp-with-spasm system SPASM domain peptide maturase n=1 Tax=Chryseobacterium sp. BIGb0232 TaxID=2940598 RepID=UPI000F482D9C|nr:grasp-with-spasm system SPASM domain peptide maturase [Chryseobacterium sp. BIGb0232]MCS4305363.1 SPASM domain peptide maturase of grasp-with-spasm system [Chryseobacterium sp. BIGb0232]ROS07574.1 SPASM domain peptide maturase of grasp-with-spasm system [Chryseobacterium nakagawai]